MNFRGFIFKRKVQHIRLKKLKLLKFAGEILAILVGFPRAKAFNRCSTANNIMTHRLTNLMLNTLAKTISFDMESFKPGIYKQRKHTKPYGKLVEAQAKHETKLFYTGTSSRLRCICVEAY